MTTCIIVENDPTQSQALKRLLADQHPTLEVLEVCETVAEAVAQIRRHNPDLLFLDVELNGDERGFDVLEQTRDARYRVIFTTGYDKYAAQAFRLSALDYLLKPVAPDTLAEAIGKLGTQREQIRALLANLRQRDFDELTVYVPETGGKRFLRLGEIVLFETKADKLRVYLKDGNQFDAQVSMTEMHTALEGLGFFRAHRSHLVNLSHIRQLRNENDEAVLLLSNGPEVHVPPPRKTVLTRMMKESNLLRK